MHGCLFHPFVSLTVSCFSSSRHAHLEWRQLLLTSQRLTTILKSPLFTRNTCASPGRVAFTFSMLNIEGLATASSIQGGVVDAMVALLKFHGINPCIKWVDNFIFFRSPNTCLQASVCPPSFNFNLSEILNIMEPLGIPWHPLLKKGHDFQSSFNYVGF